jgi:hypothetical protein
MNKKSLLDRWPSEHHHSVRRYMIRKNKVSPNIERPIVVPDKEKTKVLKSSPTPIIPSLQKAKDFFLNFAVNNY